MALTVMGYLNSITPFRLHVVDPSISGGVAGVCAPVVFVVLLVSCLAKVVGIYALPVMAGVV
jgi:hypothetical protein